MMKRKHEPPMRYRPFGHPNGPSLGYAGRVKAPVLGKSHHQRHIASALRHWRAVVKLWLYRIGL